MLMHNYLNILTVIKLIITEQQHGFRQHKSCVTQVISLIHDFAQCLNNKGQCDVLLLDFCTAFDKVPYSQLFTSYIIMESEALSLHGFP